MAKTWEQMTDKEKIEDLRRDMKATIATVNAWIDQTRRLGEFHRDLMTKHTETANRLSLALAGLEALQAPSKPA